MECYIHFEEVQRLESEVKPSLRAVLKDLDSSRMAIVCRQVRSAAMDSVTVVDASAQEMDMTAALLETKHLEERTASATLRTAAVAAVVGP
jgi:hypothetical protein